MTPSPAPRRRAPLALLAACLLSAMAIGCAGDDDDDGPRPLPDEILQVLAKPRYRNAVWGLQVVDLDTGRVVHSLNAERPFLIGSVTKLFSVGLALDALGPDHVFRTPVHRRGAVGTGGVLAGDLIVVASGDLAMGGRTNADGSYAVSDLDHNEANSLGNAQLTTPDPLAGYRALAAQVRAAGISRVTGDVIIDDRLFEPFDFEGETGFKVTPMFVNDDVIDVSVTPRAGQPATVVSRPLSAAFGVAANVASGAPGSAFSLAVDPPQPGCIGITLPCGGTVGGSVPVDLAVPLTGRFPVVRTFRITHPTDYARTVFIEALRAAGVQVDAATVKPNAAASLPATGSGYAADTKVAELVSHPYRDYARHVLKVSYNIGADTSLMLFGLTRGARTMASSLAAEREVLAADFGIDVAALHFVDGAGGSGASATQGSVIAMLDRMRGRPGFAAYFDALPRLGVDGSLSIVTSFAADPALAGAKGQVRAKTGTNVEGTATGAVLRAQTFAGYIDAKSGRRYAYTVFVNEVGKIAGTDDIIPVFQDEGTISAVLWKTL